MLGYNSATDRLHIGISTSERKIVMMEKTLTAQHSLVMKADRERVWKAITTAAHFSRWFEHKVEITRLEPGGEFIFTDFKDSLPGKIVTVEPPELFQIEWTPEPGVPVFTLVTFQ